MTAVEWLQSEMLKPNLSMKDILEQAKEMERQEIIDSYRDGRSDQQSKDGKFYNRNAEYYYNEKFKKK